MSVKIPYSTKDFDEAVKLSVKYSTESSAYFVNGILAEFIKEKK